MLKSTEMLMTMYEQKNIFISHVHKDDSLLPKLKELLLKEGMEVRDGSINSDKPNEAKNHDYIKRSILAPRVSWASTLLVLISHGTAQSDWVNWEIDYAMKNGKQIVGVFAYGATDADIPESLAKYGDAVVVGWQGNRVVKAINGEINGWDSPDTGGVRSTPLWQIRRISC